MATEKRGSIAFFSTYRPPVPLDIFSCLVRPILSHDEVCMTDGVSYNYNGQEIPIESLKELVKHPKLASHVGAAPGVISDSLSSGMIFVSERGSLEKLYISFRFNSNPHTIKVIDFSHVFNPFKGVFMEDSGCIAGDNLVYVTTREPAKDHRQPWTAVYKTNLKSGRTERLTPSGPGIADLSPSVSPSGKTIAVASFQRFQEKSGWYGEIEDLKTDIFVMDVEKPSNRRFVIKNGGWPTWGSDSVIFFHRKVGNNWGVFRATINNSGGTSTPTRVTPEGIDAMTPAAINSTTVAVATIRQKSKFNDVRVEAQYRHIEIFDTNGQSIQITQKITPKADHFNPFVMDGGKRIGYHRCRSDILKSNELQEIDSPTPDVGVFRAPGVFPTFSKDGSKLAFVDNEFKAVWVADKYGFHTLYEFEEADSVFSPVWNQNTDLDTLYVCVGPSFQGKEKVNICAFPNVSHNTGQMKYLTNDNFNNAFPSASPDGKKIVFRSTRDGGSPDYFKNLYIMEDAEADDFETGAVTRLTEGEWTDTHCEWSSSGDWIVFSSSRGKPDGAPASDNGLDPGYFGVYLVSVSNPDVVVEVMRSGNDFAGHVNHPFFSPDGQSIVVAADLAAVSVDPISLPLFIHSVRPYGDIFTFDIDTSDINNNKNVTKFKRITHSRYENSTCTWAMFSGKYPDIPWHVLSEKAKAFTPSCPYLHADGGESWHKTGHILIRNRLC